MTMDLGTVIALIALLVSGFTLWRAELRGPKVQLYPMPGSAFASLYARHRKVTGELSSEVSCNVKVRAVFVNMSQRAGYIATVYCSEPPGLMDGLGSMNTAVGSFEGDGHPEVHHRMGAVVERDHPVPITLSWWFELPEVSLAAGIKREIADPDGKIAVSVQWTSLESFLIWRRFKTRTTTIRPVQQKGDVVQWRGNT